MKIKTFLFVALATSLAVLSCSKKTEEENARISLSSQFADMAGNEGAEAVVRVESNYDNISVAKENPAADWLEVSLKGKEVTVRALSENDGLDERFVNVIVKVTGVSESNVAVATFTARQKSTSTEVRIIPEKTKPILSAAAYGPTSGYSGEDNRYRIPVTLVNATDLDIAWDRSQTWLENVEKYTEGEGVDESFAGIMLSLALNGTKESRSAKITLSVPGADYATVEITVFQKSNPFKVEIGDYDATAGGTVIYLDVEDYSFYLVIDNVQAKLPFVTSESLVLTNTASTEHSGLIVAKYGEQGDTFFNAENFPAFFYAFNRNNTSGTQYTKYSDVPSDVVSDETKWHIMSRSELAYVFKRTLLGKYCTPQSDTHTFNDVFSANALKYGVSIEPIATTGTIYWSSYVGSNKDNYVTAFATTNLKYSAPDAKKNYAFYRQTESTKSYVRCVKKVFVNE